jgi:hypothetical protein
MCNYTNVSDYLGLAVPGTEKASGFVYHVKRLVLQEGALECGLPAESDRKGILSMI